MHSSGMRTACLLTVSQQGTVEVYLSGGGVYLPKGVPAGGGGVPASEMYLPRVCTCQGGTCLGGVPTQVGYLPSGVPAGGTCPGKPPLWTDRHL